MREAYGKKVADGELKADIRQAAVAEALARLADDLERNGNGTLLSGLFGRKETQPKGLYIHGEVGRGKTMLMDLFFANVNVARKRRVHFHQFMQEVHGKLHAARRKEKDVIAPVAAAIAGEARLLCLDEMQISDIADAMIVGRLFEALLAAGTVVVTTANVPPEGLYRDGLNRALFLPFIKLMRERLEVISLDGETDYRLGRIKTHETFITPLGPEADRHIEELWRKLTDTERGEPLEIEVKGRKLRVAEAAHSCARFSFAELCEAPLGPPDFLAIAGSFRTVFVENIPALTASQRNEAKRFMILIDTLYDAQVKLVASSAKAPEGIYPAGRHHTEFARTVSRLKEMQSASWWGKKIAET